MARNGPEGRDPVSLNGFRSAPDGDSDREPGMSVKGHDLRNMESEKLGIRRAEEMLLNAASSTETRKYRSSDSELGGFYNGMELHDLQENDVGFISDDEFEKEFGSGSDRMLSKKSGKEVLYGGPEEALVKSAVHPLTTSVLKTVLYILLWYIFSTLLTMYNKLLLGKKLGNFPAPLLMNTVHFSLQALISTVILRHWCVSLRPTVHISWKDYFIRVVPTAIATALDINLSNESFVFISVTFATMCKSGAPVFLLLFAFAFKLETPSFKLLGIILIISSGVLLTAARETEFDLAGFTLVMLATVMAGFRWTVTQIFLQKEEYGLNNPLAVMSYLTPIMALITVVFSFVLEPWHKLYSSRYFDTASHALESCALMLLGGALAFCMVMAEFLVISETSAVTLTIAGVVKEVVTILAAIFFFHDSFTLFKAAGLVIIILGVCLFNWFKYQKLVQGQLVEHHGRHVVSNIHDIPVNYTVLKDVPYEVNLEEVRL